MINDQQRHWAHVATWIGGAGVLGGLYLLQLHNYLLFHTLVELASVAVACAVFMVFWNTRRFLKNGYFLFLAVAWIFIAAIDLLHTLTYKGIGIIPDETADLPTQLWIAARYLEAFSLLAAPLFIRRAPRVGILLAVYAAITGILFASIFWWRVFPSCFREGVGLSPFKVASEYVICLVLVAAVGLLLSKRREFDSRVLRLLIAATSVTIASELAFTRYVSAYGLSNFVGHILKIVAFYLIYKAIIEMSLRRPYSLLFRELRENQEALQKSEERFRILAETVPDAIFTSRSDGTTDYANPRFYEITGLARAEILAGRWTVALHPADREAIDADWKASLQTGVPFEGEHRLCTRDGSCRWFLTRARPIRDEQGQIVRWFATCTDIDAIKRMEQQLAEREQAAEAANCAKSQFLANMSHELRTPMNAILGMTDLALREELSPLVRDCLETAKESADSLLELLNEILDLSRIEAGRLQLEAGEFWLRPLLEKTVKALGIRAYQKGLELILDVAPDVPDRLVGDPTRLRQVLTNLIGNAIKFTHNGQVMLRATVAEKCPEKAILEFAVVDTGIGISPTDQEKIFAPFSQADASTTRKYGGTGLGLAISRKLVDLMGGKLKVDSSLGSGSTFSFTADFGLPSDAYEEPESLKAARARLRQTPILVVEDNGASRHTLEQILTQWEMKADCVADVPMALAKLHQAADSGQTFPLVLASAMLPGIDGFTLAGWVKNDPKLAGSVILMISPVDRQAMAERSAELDAVYLDKPISQSNLLNTILQVLSGTELPVRQADTRSAALRPEPLRKLRILLAEDTPANQKLVVYLLGKRGHSVKIAQNGKHALELLRQQPFDLVLMDVQMPVMDGLQATAKIRQSPDPAKAGIPIVAMTAHALRGDDERCLAAGMNGYLSKPIDGEELIATVERAAGDGTPSNEPPRQPTTISRMPADELRPPIPVQDDQDDAPEPAAPLFDLEEAVSKCFGRYDMFQKMVECFFEEADPLLNQIQAALDRGDAEQIATAVHRLKGTIVYLGARAAAESAKQIEQLGRAGELALLPSAIEELQQRCRELMEALARHRGGPEKQAGLAADSSSRAPQEW